METCDWDSNLWLKSRSAVFLLSQVVCWICAAAAASSGWHLQVPGVQG